MTDQARLVGDFSVMSIADLIEWARKAQKSGTLKLDDLQGKEIQVVFLDGRIISSSTNSEHERFGSYLIELGLCGPEDVEWAGRSSQEAGVMLGAELVKSGRVPRDIAVLTLTEKTVEDLCDVFLWRDGSFRFVPTHEDTRQMLLIDLDPIRIVLEGVRRRDIWHRLTARVPQESVLEPTGQRASEGSVWEDRTVREKVLELIDGTRTVHELEQCLPFGRYKVVHTVADLLDHGLARRAAVTESGQRERRIRQLMGQAQKDRDDGRWGNAIHILEGLAAAYPDRTEIGEALLETLQSFQTAIYRHHIDLADIPVIAIGQEALRRLKLDPYEGFLLSRIDGRFSVEQILKVSPIEEVQSLRILNRLRESKVIDFPHRAGPSRRREDLQAS